MERFDLFYLTSLAVSAGGFFLGYQDTVDQMNAELAGTGVSLGGGVLIGGLAFSLGISLLLWFFISKKRAVVAKWILIAFFALGLLSLPTLIAQGFSIGNIVSLISYVLSAVAVWMLFQPDAKAWFEDEKPPGPEAFK